MRKLSLPQPQLSLCFCKCVNVNSTNNESKKKKNETSSISLSIAHFIPYKICLCEFVDITSAHTLMTFCVIQCRMFYICGYIIYDAIPTKNYGIQFKRYLFLSVVYLRKSECSLQLWPQIYLIGSKDLRGCEITVSDILHPFYAFVCIYIIYVKNNIHIFCSLFHIIWWYKYESLRITATTPIFNIRNELWLEHGARLQKTKNQHPLNEAEIVVFQQI